MPNPKSSALAKLNSLKISTFNAIGELETRAEEARQAGDTAKADQHTNEAIKLAKASRKIRETEDAVRRTLPLTPQINKLNNIAQNARNRVKKLKRAANALADAAQLLAIIASLSTVF